MSAFTIFTAGLASFAALASAYTQPTGNAPVGNPISEPGLNSVVPAGGNFTIVWEPTTKGTVTLVLLKGPSSNAVPQYPIVEKTDNDGTYVWQVASDLQPSENAQGYGIQLIDDATGQYQYTTQFGISNPDYKAGSGSSSAQTSATAPSYGSTTTEAPKYTTFTTYCPDETTFEHGGKTYSVTKATTLTITEDCETTTKSHASSTSVKAPIVTGSGGVISKPANVTMVAPTGGYTPSTVATTWAKPSTPTSAPSTIPTPYKGSATSTVASSFFGLAAAAALALYAM